MYVRRRNEKRSRKHFAVENYEYYTFRECLFTALLIQDTMRIRRIVICGLTGPTLVFPHFVTK